MRKEICVKNIPEDVPDEVAREIAEAICRHVGTDEKFVEIYYSPMFGTLAYKVVKRRLFDRIREALDSQNYERITIYYEDVAGNFMGG